MKKILILLILLSSFAFAKWQSGTCPLTYNNLVRTLFSSRTVTSSTTLNQYSIFPSTAYPNSSVACSEDISSSDSSYPVRSNLWTYGKKCDSSKYDLFNGQCLPKCESNENRNSSGICVPKCKNNEIRINGQCVPKCKTDEVRNSSGICVPDSPCGDKETKINGKCYPYCPISVKITSSNMPCVCPPSTENFVHIEHGGSWYDTCKPTSTPPPPPEPCSDGLVFNFYGDCVSPDSPFFPDNANPNSNPDNPDNNNSNSNPDKPNGPDNGNLLPELKKQTNILNTINQNLAKFNKGGDGGGSGGGSTGFYPEGFKKITDNANKNQKSEIDNASKNAGDIIKAINNINIPDSSTDMKGVEDKLDKLIGEGDTVVDVDTVGIVDLLVDANGSLPTLDDDENSSIPTYDDIAKASLSVYGDFEKDAISSLDSLVGSIDYGIFGTFNIPSYDFVDYSISVPLPMTSRKLEGNLMSADFLNSLDFSLARLALLLSTLLYSVYYVINRLF